MDESNLPVGFVCVGGEREREETVAFGNCCDKENGVTFCVQF